MKATYFIGVKAKSPDHEEQETKSFYHPKPCQKLIKALTGLTKHMHQVQQVVGA